MGSRFYFPWANTGYIGALGDPSITPAYDAEWNYTGYSSRKWCSIGKCGSGAGTDAQGMPETQTIQPYDMAARQYISIETLAAQTISGTVKGQFRASESDAAMDACAAMVIKVVSGNGTTIRGTLLSLFPGALASEFATSATNRYFPIAGTSLSSVTCQAGDRLVFEIGTRFFNAVATYYAASIYFGDNAAGDLPEDESTTTAGNAWIEFSSTLDFQDSMRAYSLSAQTEYQPTPAIRAYSLSAQTEFQPTPTIRVYSLLAQVEYQIQTVPEMSPFVQTNQPCYPPVEIVTY